DRGLVEEGPEPGDELRLRGAQRRHADLVQPRGSLPAQIGLGSRLGMRIPRRSLHAGDLGILPPRMYVRRRRTAQAPETAGVSPRPSVVRRRSPPPVAAQV